MKCNGDSGNVCRQDVEVEQPWNIGLGVSMDMGNNLLVMADVTHKKWSDAKFFNEFYDDQNVVSIGVQKTMGNLKLRAGYGYADDPLLSQVQQGRQVANNWWCKHQRCYLYISNVWSIHVIFPSYGNTCNLQAQNCCWSWC